MTDIASLVLAVDSTQVGKGTAELDKLTVAGTRAEVATGALGRTTNTAAAQATRMAAEAQRMAHGVGSFGSSANNARIVGLELTHVTRNMAEQLAMGVSPARALTMEIGRLSTAAQYAGGVGGLGRMIAGWVAPFAAAAAGAGLLATALLGVKQNAASDAEMQQFIGTLGLTKKEMEKLTDTTVTWGDVGKATFQVLAENAGTSAAAITRHFSGAFHSIGEFGKFSVSVLLAAFGAMVEGTKDLLTNLPGIVGGGIAAAANLGIAALEKLVNLGIVGLNKLSGVINDVLGTHFGQVAEISLGRVQTNFGATMGAIGVDVSGTFHRIFNSTEATFDQISARATKLRQDALRAQAEDIIADRTGKAAGAHRDRARAANEEADALDKLSKQLEHLMSLEQDVDVSAKALARLQGPVGQPLQEQALSPFEQWAQSIPQTADEINAALQSISVRGFDSLASAISDVITGTRSLKDAFKDVARSIIADIIQMTVRMLIFRVVSGILGGGMQTPDLFGSNLAAMGSAKGNVFSGGNIVPFAAGGVVGGPTLFPMSGGRTGLMGEAGPEAVMPLARDSRGRLGVRANDNASGPIEVHLVIDASPDLLVKQAYVADAVYQRNEPNTVRKAVNVTIRTANRPTLMGRRR